MFVTECIEFGYLLVHDWQSGRETDRAISPCQHVPCTSSEMTSSNSVDPHVRRPFSGGSIQEFSKITRVIGEEGIPC